MNVHAAEFMPLAVSAAGGDASGLAPAGQPSGAAAQALKAGTGFGQAVITMQVNTHFEIDKSQPTGLQFADAPQFAQSQAHAHTAASSGNAQSMWPLPPPPLPNANASTAALGAHLGAGAVVSTLLTAPVIALGAQQQQQQQQQKQVEPKIAGNEKNINEFIEQLTTTLSQLNLKPEELKKLIDSAVHVLPAYQSPDEQHAA